MPWRHGRIGGVDPCILSLDIRWRWVASCMLLFGGLCSWSTFSQPISLRFILILSSHLCLGLPSGFLHTVFPAKILYAFLFCPMDAICPTHFILLDLTSNCFFNSEIWPFYSELYMTQEGRRYITDPLALVKTHTLQFLNLHECLVGVLLCLVHVASLHTMHHCHQVHQHIQVLLWHPDEHIPYIGATHTCNSSGTMPQACDVCEYTTFSLSLMVTNIQSTTTLFEKLHNQKKLTWLDIQPIYKS